MGIQSRKSTINIAKPKLSHLLAECRTVVFTEEDSVEYVNKCNHEQVRLTSFSIFLMIFSVFKLLRLGAEKLKYGGKMTWYLVNVQVSIQMVPLVCLTCEKTSVVLEGWESGLSLIHI